jgi:hypothetical protein
MSGGPTLVIFQACPGLTPMQKGDLCFKRSALSEGDAIPGRSRRGTGREPEKNAALFGWDSRGWVRRLEPAVLGFDEQLRTGMGRIAWAQGSPMQVIP